MATTVLLDLLDELIVLIILQLPLADIGALLLAGNHRLADIIRSIEVQYWIEQQLLGVEENAKVLGSLPIADRLQELRLREKSERWLEFTPSSRRVIYPPPGTAHYSFDGHVCVAAEAARVHPSMDVVDVPICLRVMQLSSSEGAADNQWQVVYRPTEDRTIISHFLASAQDLLCVATSFVQLEDSEAQVDVLSTELGAVRGELKKEAAKVTRAKRERKRAKEAAEAAQATLTDRITERQAALDTQRRYNSEIDAQLAQAKLIADEQRTKTNDARRERDKFKKQAQRAKPALETAKKTLAALQTWDPMDAVNRNMYGAGTRRMVRMLDGVGVANKHVGKVIAIVAKELGVRVKRTPKARTVGLMVREGGFLSRVKLGRELAKAKRHGNSSDGTSIKRVTYEARHIRLPVPDYTDPAAEPKFKTMVLDLDHAHDHTAQTQFEGDMAAGAAISDAYRNSPIYDPEAAPLDPMDFLRKMRWQNMDHAADGKKKLELTRDAKLLLVKEDLGKAKWVEMAELDRFNAVCAVSDKDLEKEFSAKIVAEWSLDQRKEGREALAIQRVGDAALKQLPEDEQRDADILFAGCMCHKDLNAFKYAVEALEAMWPRDDRPALLANKANDAVIRLSEDPSSAAVQNALESSTCGAMKLVALSAMTTSWNSTNANSTPREIEAGLVKPAQPFPDFQRCRFQTGGQGAAELFKFLDLYAKLVQTVADAKGTVATRPQTELAAIALYAVCVSSPYMRYARGGGSENGGLINALDTVPMHRSLVPFCKRLAANPQRLLDPATPDAELTIDGQPFMDPFVVKKVREQAADLPRFEEAITAIFTGGVRGWEIFTEEFQEDGAIAQLSGPEKEEMDIDSTNCKNEGLLGYTRQKKLKNPSGTIKLFRAQAMYRNNGTEDFITAHANSREMTVYAMREARKEDGDGSEKKFRLERAEKLIQKATDNKARREKWLQDEADRRAKLLSTPVILEVPKLNVLSVKQLDAQMKIHWRIFKDPILTAIPNKKILSKRAPLLTAVKEAVARHIIRVNSGNRGDHLVQIELLSLSGEPHPLAKTPSIYVCTHTHERVPTVGMVVMGSRIGACISTKDDSLNRLYLFDWTPIQIQIKSEFTFLSEDAVLCWTSGNSLDVFFIHPRSTGRLRQIRILLPEFVPMSSSHWGMDKTITAVTFSTVPPPDRGGHTHSSSGSRFHSATDGHITVVNFCIGSSHSYCKLVINANAFVEFARSRLRPPPRMAYLSWEHWGPQFTRFIRTNEYSGAAQLYDGASFGWRLASIQNDDVAVPIQILDFNPHRVRRLAAAIERGERDMVTDSKHARISYSPPPREGPVDAVYAPLKGQGLDSEVSCIHVVSKELFDYQHIHIIDGCIVGVQVRYFPTFKVELSINL
ncbi:hypothetical protein HMN09_00845400 [Mycena chlorophos]|uniref:Uncharacterized protein n=1 Tax=Mycena chlorophos TaxID=658473 RepID=A0A8H6ST61_MYCCL|nr:hypothetical protein HMN09_00845400 [Mycena chlorophos]